MTVASLRRAAGDPENQSVEYELLGNDTFTGGSRDGLETTPPSIGNLDDIQPGNEVCGGAGTPVLAFVAFFALVVCGIGGAYVRPRRSRRRTQLNDRPPVGGGVDGNKVSEKDKDDRRGLIKESLIFKTVIFTSDEEKAESSPVFDRGDVVVRSNLTICKHEEEVDQNSKNEQPSPADIESSSTAVCPICLCDYQDGDSICYSKNPNCSHCFHSKCGSDWLLNHSECPVCRADYLLVLPPSGAMHNKCSSEDLHLDDTDRSSDLEEDRLSTALSSRDDSEEQT